MCKSACCSQRFYSSKEKREREREPPNSLAPFSGHILFHPLPYPTKAYPCQSSEWNTQKFSSLSKMAVSLSSLTSSLSSLSFSSHISHKPSSNALTLSLARVPTRRTIPSLVVSATVAASPAEQETADLRKYVKSRLPGGFAAQTIIGTGRRKSAIARVVLQEGNGKYIINYRDAKVNFTF